MTNFYAGKKVIVTGGAGFVGSHLVKALRDQGAKVVVVDDMSRQRKDIVIRADIIIQWQDIEGVRYRNADAANILRLATIFRQEQPFAVFNLAAKVAGVVYNQQHQLEMFKANVDLQTTPVIAAEEADVPHFLQVSSVCVYGEDANAPAVESNLGGEPAGANAGYSWSKRIGEKVAEWSRLEHAVIVRPSNIYGPRDYFDLETAHVIPALIAKCQAEGDAVEVYGTGNEVREFIYVADAAAGMLHALEYGSHKEAYNLGTNGHTMVSIGELIGSIQAELGISKEIVYSHAIDAGDNVRYSDCDKIESLGWRHEVDLKTGLAKTIEWRVGQ